MTITKTLENETATVLLDGRLDTTTSPKLQEELMPVFDEANVVVLDCAKLAYISSAGLRILLMAQKMANAKKVVLKLRSVSSDVMEVFEMTGFSTMLAIETT
jgi:anti-sigma B factor antagonist